MKTEPEIIEVSDGKRIFVCSIIRRPRMKSIRARMDGELSIRVSCARMVSQQQIRDLLVRWLPDMSARFVSRPSLLPTLSRRDFYAYRPAALALAHERTRALAPDLCALHQGIAIGASKTRWGTCDAKRRLRFHYKIALLPSELVDYVVIHELCHLVELNHSPRFWSLVISYIPDALSRRKELKKYNLV